MNVNRMVTRRTVLGALTALLVASGSAPVAASPVHQDLASWLFDLYAAQSVKLSIANALRGRPPGTEDVLTAHAPGMVQQLARHREKFQARMSQALLATMTEAQAATVLRQARSDPPQLDDASRRLLFEVDAAFRRDAQDVIGAMTTDIGLMIAATLGR